MKGTLLFLFGVGTSSAIWLAAIIDRRFCLLAIPMSALAACLFIARALEGE